MIKKYKDIKKYIESGIKPFKSKSFKLNFWAFITKVFNCYRIRFCVHLRKLEYYTLHPRLFFFLKWWHKLRKNSFNRIYGLEIPSFICEKGLHLWHPNVVINDDAKIGKNALFHGNNCIGRKNDTPEGNFSQTIGDNFNMGFGASAFGRITIGSNVLVGANTTILGSFGDNLLICGTPARIIKIN